MRGDGARDVKRLINDAEEIELDFEAAVAELAKLPRLEYDGLRKSEALRLRVRLSTLDDAVTRARSDDDPGGVPPSQRDRLIEIGTEYILWHDPDGEAYATVKVDKRREHYPIRSEPFRRRLLGDYGGRHRLNINGRSIPTSTSEQAYSEAVNVLVAAAAEGKTYKPCIRVGLARDAIYVDLGDDDWDAIRITAEGWDVVSRPRVRFTRQPGMRPLPTPRLHKGLDRLRRFVNLRTDDDFALIVAWLVGAFWPTGPYPILVLAGEQGAAKSTLARVLRRLTDPSKVELSAPPKSELDLILAAKNSWILAFDNVSHFRSDMYDALCRLATGTGWRTRQLYTDGQEYLVEVSRPVMLNGIPDLVTRPDFAERSIVITLPHIPNTKRLSEAEFWERFEIAYPDILAGLLDAMVLSIRNYRAVDQDVAQMPRMADFLCRACAAAPSFGYSPEELLGAYRRNQELVNERGIEADQVASAVKEFIANEGDWAGSATGLLNLLNRLVTEEVRRHRSWPKIPGQLSNRLRRAAAGLRRLGITIDLDARDPKTRVKQIHISAD